MKAGKYVFITTIDVEADNAWEHPEEISLNNLSILPEFQELCRNYSIIPTYLLSYETLSDDDFVSFIISIVGKAQCEIGIHPHVWTIPPFEESNKNTDSRMIRYFQSMLDEDLLYSKLNEIHNSVFNKIGITPTSHRAGRWGLCLRTVKWLEENNYIVDTSVVPFKSYKNAAINPLVYPDYHAAQENPYHMSINNLLKPGNLTLVEIPTTNTAKTCSRMMIQLSDLMHNKRGGHRFRKLLLNYSMYPRELRPYPEYPNGTLTELAKLSIEKKIPIINLMFHSSELMKGTSPYSSTQEKTNRIWKHIEEVFSFMREQKIPSLGISEAVTSLKQANYFKR